MSALPRHLRLQPYCAFGDVALLDDEFPWCRRHYRYWHHHSHGHSHEANASESYIRPPHPLAFEIFPPLLAVRSALNPEKSVRCLLMMVALVTGSWLDYRQLVRTERIYHQAGPSS